MGLYRALPSCMLMQVCLFMSSVFAAQMQDGSEESPLDVRDKVEHLSTVPSVVAAIAIPVGIACIAFGYKLLRPMMFICAALVGGIAASTLVDTVYNFVSDEPDNITMLWVSFCVGALFLGILVLCIYSAGIWLIGIAGGVALAIMFHTSFGLYISPKNPDAALLVMIIIFGIAGGIAAHKIEKPVMIVATSLVGAYLFMRGIGHFIGHFPDYSDLKEYRTQGADGKYTVDIPGAWWGYLAAIVVVTMIGLAIQFKVTGRHKHDHKGKGKKSDHV